MRVLWWTFGQIQAPESQMTRSCCCRLHTRTSNAPTRFFTLLLLADTIVQLWHKKWIWAPLYIELYVYTLKVSQLLLAATRGLRWTTSEILQSNVKDLATCVGHYHGQRLGLARPRRLQFCPDSDSVVGAAASQKVFSHLFPYFPFFPFPYPNYLHLYNTW